MEAVSLDTPTSEEVSSTVRLAFTPADVGIVDSARLLCATSEPASDMDWTYQVVWEEQQVELLKHVLQEPRGVH